MTDGGVSVTERTLVYDRVGFATPDAKTAQEALEAADLDWDIELRPATYEDTPGHHAVVPKRFVTVRADTDQPLGIVGSHYTPIVNRAGFAFADNLVHGGGLFESAYQRRDGCEVGLTMRFPDHVLIGGEDPIERYLIMRMNHDGSCSVNAAIGNLRLGCLNQFGYALAGATNRVVIRHTRSAMKRVEQARELLELSIKATDVFAEEAEQLLAMKVSEREVSDLIDSVLKEVGLGKQAMARHKGGIIENLHETETLPDPYRKTGWGVLNAVGEYYDHVFGYRTEDSALVSALEGRGFKAKAATHRLLLTR